MKINSLFIKSFRGATQPLTIGFDTAKKITMIFGENGNGKSTVADALACLCTNGYGSIQDKPSVDKSYLCAIGSKPQDVLVSLDTDIGKFNAILKTSPLATFTKSPEEGIPTLRFLRRKQIIDLIDDVPSKRYEKLQEYIDVSGIMASEDTLRKLIKSTKSDLDKETKSLSDAIVTLEKAWEDEGKPQGSMEDWAKAESAKDISKESEKHSKLSMAIKGWQDVKGKFTTVKNQKEESAQSILKVEKLEQQLLDLQKSGKGNSIKLLTVLESAQGYISDEPETKNCPVCGNGIIRKDILKSLETQIGSMKILQKASKDLAEAKKARVNAEAILENGLKEFNNLTTILCGKLSDMLVKDSAAAKMNVEILKAANKNEGFVLVEKNLVTLEDLVAKMTGKAAEIDKTIKQFNLISSNYKGIVNGREKAQNLTLLSAAIEKTHKTVESNRKHFIETSLSSVSSDIEALYAKMHPGEGLGDIKLFLKEIGKSSIEITSTFHSEKDITPQSLYSESHLDTLGICIFIALAKKYNQGNTILLLDDVMMSVDETHLDRFIDVLHDISDNFAHVLITTHYRPWRDRYRNNRAPAAKVHFLELRQWSKERGISLQNGRIATEELRQLLKDDHFHRGYISGSAGIILENLLDFLTFKFGSKIVRKPGNDYQLRELLDSLSKGLIKVMKVEQLVKDTDGKFSKVNSESELRPIFDKIKELSAVRNQVGAHFNFVGSLVSDSDVKEFAESVLQLADLLTCPELGSLPDRSPSGSYWETKSGSVRLHPLREPS